MRLSSVAAYLSTSAVEGLVQGQGGPRLRMNYLPSEVALSTGDLVYTSPTSATFPGEILLGRVVAINPRDPFLTFQSVEVRPAADAAALSHVMVLRPAGAAVPAAASAEPAPLAVKPRCSGQAPQGRSGREAAAPPPAQVKKSSGTLPPQHGQSLARAPSRGAPGRSGRRRGGAMSHLGGRSCSWPRPCCSGGGPPGCLSGV